MKDVICAKCGKTVSKRSTMSINGQRICRTHEEVQQHHDDIMKNIKEKNSSDKLQKVIDEIFDESLISALRVMAALDILRYKHMMYNIRINKGYDYYCYIRDQVSKSLLTEDEAKTQLQNSVSTYLNFKNQINES